MGAPKSSSSESASDRRSSSSSDSGTYEKWLVRILLTLAFGLAFGIEGMTLLRSFVFDPVADEEVRVQSAIPVLQEGDVLAPGDGPAVRVKRLRLFATDEAWTFILVARPDTAVQQRYTVVFDTLKTTNGRVLTSAPSRTWTVNDTAAFTAKWALPPGQRPSALTISTQWATAGDGTNDQRRSVEVGHVPVRMQ